MAWIRQGSLEEKNQKSQFVLWKGDFTLDYGMQAEESFDWLHWMTLESELVTSDVEIPGELLDVSLYYDVEEAMLATVAEVAVDSELGSFYTN